MKGDIKRLRGYMAKAQFSAVDKYAVLAYVEAIVGQQRGEPEVFDPEEVLRAARAWKTAAQIDANESWNHQSAREGYQREAGRAGKLVEQAEKAVKNIPKEAPQPAEPVLGCPESDEWNCKYCHRVNSCPVKHLRDAQPAAQPADGQAWQNPQTIWDAALEWAAKKLKKLLDKTELDTVPIDTCYSHIQDILALKSKPESDRRGYDLCVAYMAGRTDGSKIAAPAQDQRPITPDELQTIRDESVRLLEANTHQSAQEPSERKAFESEFNTLKSEHHGFRRTPNGKYYIQQMQWRWEGWQARALLAQYGRPAIPAQEPSDDDLIDLAISESLAYIHDTLGIVSNWREDIDISDYIVGYARALLARCGDPQPSASRVSDTDRLELVGALGLLRGHGYTGCADALRRVLDADAAAPTPADGQAMIVGVDLTEDGVQIARDAALEEARSVLDEIGARLQQAHDGLSIPYLEGVAAMVFAGEDAIEALKSKSAQQERES